MDDLSQPEIRAGRFLMRSLAGWKPVDLPGDLAAGLTLAAIAIPEQMATARLGGFPPDIGLFVFVAGTIGFFLFGANRYLSSGADSTITPIFAGALAMLTAQGSANYGSLAAGLAVAVGVLLLLGGLARLGWIASFLSVPVTTGFLAGIAVHIVVSQLPAALGVAAPDGTLLTRGAWLLAHLSETNPYTLILAALVLGASSATERLGWRIPGALIGLIAAMVLVGIFGWADKGVAVVNASPVTWPRPSVPAVPAGDWENIGGLALVLATVAMVQTAATTRSFASLDDPRDINQDFIGVGAGNILAGLFGLFPVNASPPRTAAVEASGGRSQLSGLCAALLVLLVLIFGGSLLHLVPLAALSGILFAIALRIARPSTFSLVLRQTPMEFALIVATMAAIVILPIQSGVAIGIGLSVLHGIWTITRTQMMEFEKVPGTSVWWPPSTHVKGEKLPHVRVVAFQAPLSFLNADEFRRDMIEMIERGGLSLIVFEASGVAEIDFTAAQVLVEIVERCHKARIRFAIARLTSLRAQEALARFGIVEKLGPHGLYRSVDDAIRALADAPPQSD